MTLIITVNLDAPRFRSHTGQLDHEEIGAYLRRVVAREIEYTTPRPPPYGPYYTWHKPHQPEQAPAVGQWEIRT